MKAELVAGGAVNIQHPTSNIQHPRARIHLAVIAGREEAVVERFLRSFGGHVDAVVICYARGAAEADGTSRVARAVCAELGVVLAETEYFNAPEHRDWGHVDDFAAARNKAFELALKLGIPGAAMTPPFRGPDWLMWADLDDLLAPSGAEVLRDLRGGKPIEAEVVYGPYVTGQDGSYARRERLIRAEAFDWWRNPVHEVMQAREGARMAWCAELQVVHLPAVDKKGSPDRNLRILEAKGRELRTGADWFMLFREYEVCGRVAEAIGAAIQATGCAELSDQEKHEAYLAIGRNIRASEEAERPLLEAARLMPHRREPYAELVSVHLSRTDGDARKALAWARVMQGVPVPEGPEWNHNAALYGWKGDDLLWLAMGKAGDLEGARVARKRALKHYGCRISVAHPTCRPARAKLIRQMWLERARRPECVEYVFGVNQAEVETVEALRHYPHAVSAAVSTADRSSAVANYNVAVGACSGPIVICAQDDIYPPHGWDELVFQALKPHLALPRVLWVHDGFRPDSDPLMVVQCVTRAWLVKHGGRLFCSEYDGYYSDTEFSVRAVAAKEVVNGRHIRFYHDHPAFTGAGSDESYMRQQNPEACKRGKGIFMRRNPGVLK